MQTETLLTQLENVYLIRRVGEEEATYMFKHVLTQDAAYHSLLVKQRREIHRHVAHAYEAEYGNTCLDDYAGILAKHYLEAGDDEQTLIYATRAGDLAARAYANTEAIVFYAQALDAAKRNPATTTAQLIHVYTKRGRVFEVTGRDDQAFATYEEMTEFARTRGDRMLELESLLLQGKLRSVPSVVFDRAKALVLADQANILARELGNRKAEAQLLWIQQLLYQYNSEIPDAIRYGEQALALARELNARELLGYILGDLARAYQQSGQIDQVPAVAEEARAIWRELDNKPMLADNLMQSATQALMRGDYDQTIALTNEGIEISKAIDSKLSLLSNQGTQLFPYLDRGEIAHALQLVNDIVRVSLEMKLSINPPMAYAFAAMTYGFLGAYDRGEEMAQHARANLDQPIPEFFRAWGWVLLARYYLIVGNLDAAVAALSASQMENHPERLDPANIFGVIAQGECLLAQGNFERAVQVMAERVALLRQLGLRQSLHDALFIQAKAMRALGKTEQAIELLQQARIVSEGMQARRLLWQIYAILSEIQTERGNDGEAKNFRAQAREIIDYIIAHTPPEFRDSFLNLPNVRNVMKD